MKLILFLILSVSVQAKELNISEFLNQVQTHHEGFKASQFAQEGAALRVKEADLLTLPQLSLTGAGGESEKPNSNPAMGNKNKGQNIELAISEQTSIGLAAKLKYNWMFQDTEGASATFIPKPEYYTASPSIEFSQSLWRNGFGSEVRALQDLVEANARLTHYSENFKVKYYLTEAHNTYLRLFYIRQTVKALKESLSVSEKLKQWAQKRTATNLGERSDYLQTKAAFELRQLELTKIQSDEKSVARFFNSLRGMDSDTVSEDLVAPTIQSFKSEPFDDSKWRDDVRAAVEGLKLAKAKSQVDKEKNTPTLEVFGSYALNSSLDPNPADMTSSEAISSSFESDRSAYTVGIRFSTPLAFGKASDVRSGYDKEISAADLNLQRKFKDQQRDYYDLQEKISNAFQRLKLAQVLEESQKEKLDAERKRHSRGRTTLFQVLQYEQDFVSSQLNTIRTESEYQMLLNEFNLYKGSSI